MRARYYNAENSGRFINRDPIGQNDQVNLYTYVANSPLKYTDRMGRDKVLIIGFTWRDPYSFWEITEDGYSQAWIGQILNTFRAHKNTTVKGYYPSATKLGSEKWDAYDYALENKGKYNKLVLMWHSLWADNVVELANELKKQGINVDLLITIDLQAVVNTTEVPDNVWIAKNYYQTNFTSAANWESLSLANWNSTTKLTNTVVNTTCDIKKCTNPDQAIDLHHTDIDDELTIPVVKDIFHSIYNK